MIHRTNLESLQTKCIYVTALIIRELFGLENFKASEFYK